LKRRESKYLQKAGLKFLTANFRTGRGELDPVFRAAPPAVDTSKYIDLPCETLLHAQHGSQPRFSITSNFTCNARLGDYGTPMRFVM
jgi:hypothetical protein